MPFLSERIVNCTWFYYSYFNCINCGTLSSYEQHFWAQFSTVVSLLFEWNFSARENRWTSIELANGRISSKFQGDLPQNTNIWRGFLIECGFYKKVLSLFKNNNQEWMSSTYVLIWLYWQYADCLIQSIVQFQINILLS